jgi:hypothetical protein
MGRSLDYGKGKGKGERGKRVKGEEGKGEEGKREREANREQASPLALFPFYPLPLFPSSPLPFLFPLAPLWFASVTVSKLLFTLDSES